MSGTELTVGGWFASSIIRNIIDIARSYLGSNYALHSGTAEMLTSLENSLPRIQAVIEVASKRPTTNGGLIRWIDNLKNAAYEVKDVLDDLEAKRFRECVKGKNKVTELLSSSGKLVKTLIFSDKELKGFKSAVEKFNKISLEGESLLNVLDHEFRANANREHTNSHTRETSSYLDPNAKIFGRDMEIYFILDMILNYRSMFFSEESSNQKLESQSELPDQKEVKLTSIFSGYRTILEKFQRAFDKGNTSEVKREGKGQEKSNIAFEKGNMSEVKREGKDQEKSTIILSVGEKENVYIRKSKLPVLPICGLGGVGKTTIAKMVYNNDIVKGYFDRRVWVYVPEKFDVKIIMYKIIYSLSDDDNNSIISIETKLNLNTIVREEIETKLIRIIRHRRFFLVLDDVREGTESKLSEDLFPVLGNGAPGSFVVVTTQSEHVANIIGNVPKIISLGVLEPEWFDLLFKYYAFGDLFSFDQETGESSISCRNNDARAQFGNLSEEELSYFESTATKIAKKLHGLPLAGRVIGKILHSQLERLYWEDILKSDWWDDGSTAKEEILASLSIGYQDLDLDLQQCFKFCSIFPKYYVFDRNRLVQMWMTHDFIEPNVEESRKLELNKIRLEDIGYKRFGKLVDRSFFQETICDGKYVMHDLIRDLAIAVSSNSKEFYYLNSLDNPFPSSACHVGIDCDGSNIEGKSPDNTNLRTLILFGNWISFGKSISNVFAKSSGLFLLDLSYIGFRKNGSINTICRLSHLRFIDLSFSGIKLIPEKFCELYHLQVLDVRGCNFRKLPKNMNELINLRHLYASAETLSLIFGIGKLTNLQKLEEFRIGKSMGHGISELGDMNEIREHLLLTNLQNVTSKEEASRCQFAKKKYLKSLELTFCHNKDQLKTKQSTRVELEVLEALKPSLSVEILTIRGGRGDSLPGWMWSTQSGLSNLKCIKLGDFALITLSAFGELHFLEVLSFEKLAKLEKVGDEFYGRSDAIFRSLKELEFSLMYSWRTWLNVPAEKMSFPLLKKINLKNCVELIKMPTNIFTSSVVQLELSECFKINNIETILKLMPYLIHLSITGCCDDLSIYGTALRILEILCLEDVKHLCFVGGLKSLVNLRKLELAGFKKIVESFEEGEGNDGTCQENRFLTSLNLEYLYDSNISGILPFAGNFGYLRSLVIKNSPVIKYTEEERSWFSQLTSLEMLKFSHCGWLRGLPSTLPLLNKLRKLTIVSCPKISSLPEFGLPPNLTELCMTECSDELVRRCQPEPDEGDDWWKISHIQQVQINRVKVYNPFHQTLLDYE